MSSHEVAPPSRNQERVVAEFRARGGKVGGYHASMQLLLLTTTGARTGQRRAVPLTYLPARPVFSASAPAGHTQAALF